MLGAPIRVIGVVPATENMPGGRAIKPGDILKSAEGKTVEVINTDAEGRLILGDGLWYARKLGATHLVDVATLTGAIVVALGKLTTGVFGTPDWWVEQVRRVGDRAGDRMWPMPIDRGLLRSAEERDRGFHQHRRATRRSHHRRAVSRRNSPAVCRGRISTSPAPRGPRKRGRICQRADRRRGPNAGRTGVHVGRLEEVNGQLKRAAPSGFKIGA